MSAICGIGRFDGAPVDRSEIEAMVASSPYRGPDGTGYWIEGNAGFAHQAFHVTPESVHERQPLVSEDGRYVLCADARLDNREELFRSLAVPRDPGRVVTDPELILLAWLKWGEACPEKLLGDFVFSIWDCDCKSLFVARDPLGGFCLHRYANDRVFAFASELTALLDLPLVEGRINEERVLREIEFLPRNQRETFFEEIEYLPPAHRAAVSAGGISVHRYWDVDSGIRIRYTRSEEYVEHLLDLLNQSVADRLRSKGPVGISMSGGCDSTLLAAVAARNLAVDGSPQQDLMSFSYVFDRFESCDERQWIEPVVQQYSLDARYLPADELWTFRNLDPASVPRDYLWTNGFANLPRAVAHAAGSAGCRVLMDGQLGDALFGGPNLAVADLIHGRQYAGLVSYLRQHAAASGWFNEAARHGIGPNLPSSLQAAYRRIRVKAEGCFIQGLTENRRKQAIELRSNPVRMSVPAGLAPGTGRRYRAVLNPAWSQGMAAVRGEVYNRNGIEPVSPYFDRRLVEFVLSIPSEEIVGPKRPRMLQRRAMRSLLPKPVWQREHKTSFEPLLAEGLLRRELETVESLLRATRIVDAGWVEADWLRRQLDGGEAWDDNGYPFSNCLHLELWLRAQE